MAERAHGLTFGFPTMQKEPGERRDFLPSLIHLLADPDARCSSSHGVGCGMGYLDKDYTCRPRGPHRRRDEAFEQDIVVVLRAPIGKFEQLRRGTALVSMLHFPTRPAHVRHRRRSGSTRSASTRSRTTPATGSWRTAGRSDGTGSRPRSRCWSADPSSPRRPGPPSA